VYKARRKSDDALFAIKLIGAARSSPKRRQREISILVKASAVASPICVTDDVAFYN